MGGAIAFVFALLTLLIVFVRKSERRRVEIEIAKEQAHEVQEANKELAKPRSRKSVVSKLRDGKF